MLDLAELAVEAERMAETARRARCCDALRPCRRCRLLRLHVIARRLVIAHPRREVRTLHCTPAAAAVADGTGTPLATVAVIATAAETPVPLAC